MSYCSVCQTEIVNGADGLPRETSNGALHNCGGNSTSTLWISTTQHGEWVSREEAVNRREALRAAEHEKEGR